jgi:hypothetical protein
MVDTAPNLPEGHPLEAGAEAKIVVRVIGWLFIGLIEPTELQEVISHSCETPSIQVGEALSGNIAVRVEAEFRPH